MDTLVVPPRDVARGSLVYFGAHSEDLLGAAWIVTAVEEREDGRWAMARGAWHKLGTHVFIEKPTPLLYTDADTDLLECNECASLVRHGSRRHHDAWHFYILQE